MARNTHCAKCTNWMASHNQNHYCADCIDGFDEDKPEVLEEKGIVRCIGCSKFIEMRRYGSHRRTKQCKHSTRNRSSRKQGCTTNIYETYATRLKELGIKVVFIPNMEQSKEAWGGLQGDHKTYDWAAILVNLDVKQYADYRKMGLRRAKDEPSFQKAVMAAHRLGNGVAVKALLVSVFNQPVEQHAGYCKGKITRAIKHFGKCWPERKKFWQKEAM